jgi:transposase
VAHFHVKRKKGRPYLYVREIARVGGKPTVTSQVYVGSPERVREMVEGVGAGEVRLRVEEFGALWLAQQLDAGIDLAGIVDAVVGRGPRESGPTVGEYFLYAVWNRMIEAKSKRALASWYRSSAIGQIRPVQVEELTSERYWEKWERVSEAELERIARRFFERVWELERPAAECLLFDTSNYYTFMASQTPSELAKRGKNKAGRHQLRQIGVGLLVARDSRLPLHYTLYPGNVHDSKHFRAVMDEMFALACGLAHDGERLTVVIDKGMNATENMAWLDEREHVHFVTSYSPYFAQELAMTPLARFEPLEIERNQRRLEEGRDHDRLLAYRTRGVYWGKDRAVVITFNPATARKQAYRLEGKLEALRAELLIMRAKVREGAAQWRDPERVRERYQRACERLHLPSDSYQIHLEQQGEALRMRFKKDAYRLERRRAMLGKSIIITDNTDWSTNEIVQAHLDRYQVEHAFRSSKAPLLVGVQPIRHWTDSKIRCHLLTCVIAMTHLRRLELRLQQAGTPITANAAMDEMKRLHSVLAIPKGRKKPERRLEQPTQSQSEVLTAFAHRITPSGVLQQTFS